MTPKRLTGLLLWAGIACLASGPAAAQGAPALNLPVDCEIGVQCFVQNYVDSIAGPEAKDHTCGPLTYNDHGGTDIRVPTYADMAAGVRVVAAAPGTVKATRDGMDDISVREIGRAAIEGRNAGNAVLIDHGDGWITLYGHLRKGSVVVKKGDQVEAGQTLGLIGLSGNTEFPHVEFRVEHNGTPIDPYTGLARDAGCGTAKDSLWSETAQAQLAYQAGGLLTAGFAEGAVELEQALHGAYDDGAVTARSPGLVFWAVAWGLRKDDSETIRIIAPDGSLLVESTKPIPKDKAQWVRFAGRKLKTAGWPKGRYQGQYRVERSEGGVTTTIVDITRELEIR